MGLWIKNADGTIEKAAGGGGGGGPHDHAEYALVEHDHDEFVHDHDYLPLAGGTLTGKLETPITYDTGAPDVGLYLASGVDRIAGFQGQLWTYGRLVANDDVVVNRTKLWLERLVNYTDTHVTLNVISVTTWTTGALVHHVARTTGRTGAMWRTTTSDVVRC